MAWERAELAATPCLVLTSGRSAAAARPAHYLNRIGALLWPAPARVILTNRGREARAMSSPGGGAVPDRGSVTEELIVLPRRSHPRLLVPPERRAAAAAVQRYGVPGSRAARLGQHAIGLAMASGAGGRLFGGRLLIQARPDSPTISSYLRSELGRDIRLSIHLRPARANRKPVLHLLTPGGESIGFAKVGIDPLTCRLVRAEHQALSELACVRMTTLRVPPVVHYGNWNDLPCSYSVRSRSGTVDGRLTDPS